MTTDRALQAPLSQQLMSLALAALVTTGLLGGVLTLAADDQQALLASQSGQGRTAVVEPQAVASMLVLPRA